MHERFYSDTATTAPWLAFGGPARQYAETGFIAASTSLPMPGDRTVYFQAQPTAVWRPEIAGGPLAETPPWQLFHAGQELSTNWNAYPLHPAPNLPPAGVTKYTLPSAVRAGNKLFVDITPFSDNTPGHTGSGVTRFNGIKGSGSYAIYANGAKIASGNGAHVEPVRGCVGRRHPRREAVADRVHSHHVTAGTRQQPVRHERGHLDVAVAGQAARQSCPPRGTAAPASPVRGIVYDHHCAVQDMMTLDYQLARESLDGSTPAGPQSLGIAINHLPRSTPYPVTHAQLQVSFNNGTSWQPAALARICHGQVCTNQFRATYTAPAGAQVSLRVTARDTHGASVTETILGAYQTV